MDKPETPEQTGLRKVSYRKPSLSGRRGMVRLAKAGTLSASVHFLAEGARQGLHAHNAHDAIYLALAGRMRFYGAGNVVAAEIGPNEAVVVPHGTTYGFEAVGGEAQFFYVSAVDRGLEDRFFNREAGSNIVDFELFAADGTLLKQEHLELGGANDQSPGA